MMRNRSFLALAFLLCSFLSYTQGVSFADTVIIPSDYKPEFRRQLNHENIDAEQRAILSMDGTDQSFNPSINEEINMLLTRALIRKTDIIQYLVETDTVFDHRLKVNYLKGLENILKDFKQSWKLSTNQKVNPLQLPAIIDAYTQCMERDRHQDPITDIIHVLPYDAARVVVGAGIFEKNPGYKASRNLLISKYCHLFPDETFITLKNNPDVPFADSLVRTVAKRYPVELYNYAQASNKLGNIIRGIDDDFIRAVVRMSGSKSGQQYFPFLDNIVSGRITFDQIDAAEKDSVLYYQLLVRTQMEYVKRSLQKDTAFAFQELTAKLEKKAREVFITTINGLHNEPDAVRFQCLQSLSAQELYYLAVLTDGLIYTSSYTNGVYPLMMKKAGNRGDSLLLSLHFDHYRKFISQAAAYNTLSSFLSTFPGHGDATALMQAFAGNLEKTEGLEDGVDVADSYASIIETNPKLAAEVLSLVKENYERNLADNNKRGIHIYNILYKLFLSADSTKNINLTKELGIPAVYNIPFSSLSNEKDEVIIQVFFYGDKDTREVDFPEFVGMFSNANWAIDRSNEQWVMIRSVKGKPVVIYANRALPEETGEDDEAQRALGEYLEKSNLHPTITIHRGHSYYANSTISYMSPSSRIVFMGSCGGFHVIDNILQKSSDAHIIASKQIGMRAVNKPFFRLLTEKLKSGNNIDWLPFWKEFRSNARVEGFEDYIPPYKNLGAIFIKAYKKAMTE
jgi:hypothetical protein